MQQLDRRLTQVACSSSAYYGALKVLDAQIADLTITVSELYFRDGNKPR
jgi:hypothetical protein